MIFSCDDLNTKFMDYFSKHLDPIAAAFPNFRLIAFVTPRWSMNCDESRVNLDFARFLKLRPWIQVAGHGLFHSEAENLLPYEEQFKRVKECYRIVSQLPNFIPAYKPPFYKWNKDTPAVVKAAGFKLLFTQNGFLDLKTLNFYKRKDVGLLDSHTNPDAMMMTANGKSVPIHDRLEYITTEWRALLANSYLLRC